MLGTESETMTMPSSSPRTLSRWQPPDSMVSDQAEAARLSKLSTEGEQAEWDALPEAEKKAYDEAFDRVMRDIAERKFRVEIWSRTSR